MSRIMIMVGLVFALVAGASAELTLNIDTGAKTFSFSGTDSGNAEYIEGLFFLIDWSIQPSGWWSSQSIDIGSTAFEEVIDNASLFVNFSVDGGTDGLELAFSNDVNITDTDITTLTGTGVAISYSSRDADHQGVLDGYIGSTIPLVGGYGYSDINVASIPEPATIALLAAGGIALLRRNKKLKSENAFEV